MYVRMCSDVVVVNTLIKIFRIVLIVWDNLHQLIFRSVRKSDFGNYTFRAENKLGMADVSFKLTGIYFIL